jgi:hypothetical protein
LCTLYSAIGKLEESWERLFFLQYSASSPFSPGTKQKVFPPTFNLVAYIWRTVSEGGSACPQKLWGWHNRWNVNIQRALSPNSCQQSNIIWTICVRIPLTIAGWIYFSPLRLCGGGGLVRIRRHPGHMLPSQPSPHTLISPMRVQPFTFSIPTNIGPTVELWIY